PRFVKPEEQQHPPAKPRSTTSSLSSPSALAPGDENWDDRFDTLGMTAGVYAIAMSGSDVYAGGAFDTAGGLPANGIAKWDGSNWSDLGSGWGRISAIRTSGCDVYVGGGFTSAGGVPARDIAKWDGSTWSALGSGIGYIGQYS